MSLVNYIIRALILLITLIAIIAICLYLCSSINIHFPENAAHSHALPLNSFTQSKEAYAALAGPPFELHGAPIDIQLPDLRGELIFLGTNARPDASQGKAAVHLGFKGHNDIQTLLVDQVHYLRFERKDNPEHYSFSKNNIPTNLWIIPRNDQGQFCVEVGMCNQEGESVSTPAERARFPLKASESKANVRSWTLGKWRADGSLLARQRARWYGEDLFFSAHGGDEYLHLKGKHRLDFGEGEENYSCYAATGDYLIWKDERWQNISKSVESHQYPLLHIKKIDDKLIALELWDTEGISKVSLSMMRSRDAWLPQHLKDNLRFVGAKTWSQFLIEAGTQRLDVGIQDWLLLTAQGWKKLATAGEINAYLQRHLIGELLVLDRLEKRGGKQILIGHLFNSARSETQPMEIPFNPPSRPPTVANNPPARKPVNRQAAKEQNEDDTQEEPEASLPSVMRGIIEEGD
jgi:hypothetical protein